MERTVDVEAVLALERDWGRWSGTKNVVACSSGTAALHLSLECLRLPPSSGVVMADFGMIACPRACTLAGLVPIFVDVTPDTLLLDPDRVDEACSLSDIPISAVMPVHIYGRRCAMDEIAALADKYGLKIVEDGAEAHGILPHPRTDAYAVSFYKNKAIAGSEGGAVSFRNPAKASLARQLRCLGFDDNHDYRHVPRGCNYRLANVLAEQILASLAEADANLAKRREIEGWYDDICPVEWRMPTRHSVWVYDLRIPNLTRERQGRIVRRLNAAGIAARHSFYPLSLQEEYRGHGGHFPAPNARRASEECFYLPACPRTVTEDSVKTAMKIIEAEWHSSP